ncbi:MAG TPA: hypothetical protein VLI72_16195 [Methylibium sp.]|nr:hypothetical protein [Methylibium sp.]
MNTSALTAAPPADLPGDVALALLERSMDFGHGGLAVVRLALALKSGAAVSERHWQFCRDVMSRRHDPELDGWMRAAQRLDSTPCLSSICKG